MRAQRGMTLIEVLLVAAILAMVSAIAFLSSGSRAFETRSAATIFDARLAHARAIAATSGGTATLVFAPSPSGSGTVVSLSPPTDVPPETLRADVSEPVLGKPPFSISLDPYGRATAPAPCPPAGGYALTFAAGTASETRFLPCPAVAAGSPEPVGTVPP
jgi:prepilin-type N-terminal cleavage/methylation domain-containing protein